MSKRVKNITQDDIGKIITNRRLKWELQILVIHGGWVHFVNIETLLPFDIYQELEFAQNDNWYWGEGRYIQLDFLKDNKDNNNL